MLLKARTALEGFPELLEILSAEVEQYKRKADDVFPPVMPVGEWPALSSFTFGYGGKFSLGNTATLFKTISPYNSYDNKDFSTTDQVEQRKVEIERCLTELEQEMLECEEGNNAAIENNTLLRNKVSAVMEKIGVCPTYSVFETPKGARTQKWVTHAAGYIADMTRHVPVTIKGLKPNVQQLRQTVKQKYEEALAVVRKVEYEKQKKETEAIQAHELALLRAKYCPDNAFADRSTVRDAILSNNKYLCLAYWMERNRGDWSDGYDYAEIGYNQFIVEDETDQEIDDEIGEMIRNEAGDYYDGRCFRDCKWNYDVLYSMCKDATLIEDLNKINAME